MKSIEKSFLKKKYLLLLFLLIMSIVFIFTVNFKGNSIINNNSSSDNREILTLREFNNCLAENGIVVYGTMWCPACRNLINILGGYEAVTPVYIDCAEEMERCDSEMKTKYIPEIQINGELYTRSINIEGFSKATGCKSP